MPPKVIGPYRVLETLGSGGVGTVYRAVDRRTGEDAALKLLSTGPALDPRAAKRLAREFETLEELSHPNIVKVYDTGVFQGYPYLAMELVEGLTLRHYLSLSGDDLSSETGLVRAIVEHRQALNNPLENAGHMLSVDTDEVSHDYAPSPLAQAFDDEADSEDVLRYESGPSAVREFAKQIDEPDTMMSFSGESAIPFDVPTRENPMGKGDDSPDLAALNRPERVGRIKDVMLQLCQALSYIHGHGLIHRDLKPTNVMVDEDHLVRLMDFGLAKFVSDDAGVTADGRLVGTFRYMAPEQVLGDPLDARTDLYALGVILYELLTGRAPFDARTPHELWQKVLETEPTPILAINPQAERALARIAHRLIRKEPKDRFQTAEEIGEALTE